VNRARSQAAAAVVAGVASSTTRLAGSQSGERLGQRVNEGDFHIPVFLLGAHYL
jgi:hypothetical protein